MGRACIQQTAGDLLYGLVPAYGLEAALASFAHTAERAQHAVGAVSVIYGPDTLGAELTAALKALRDLGTQGHRLSVFNCELHGAAAGAHRTAAYLFHEYRFPSFYASILAFFTDFSKGAGKVF